MIRKLIAGSALALVASGAHASDFDYLDIYFVPSSDLELTVPGFGSGDDDGDGFGIKGKAHIADTVTIHGEYQTVNLDESDVDVNQLRFGIGFHSVDTGSGVRFFGDLEFVDVELEDDSGSLEDDGFGFHGGLLFSGNSSVSGFARLGYLSLDDSDGFEFGLGLIAQFSEAVGGFIDYRSTSLEDDNDIEYELDDIRIGLRFLFGTQ